MKKSSSLLQLLLAFYFLFPNHRMDAQTRHDFNGLWRTSYNVLIHIKDTSNTIVARYLNSGDCADGPNCVIGGGGEYYLKGTIDQNNKMDIKMRRCTHKKAMRDEGLASHWETLCKVKEANSQSISGTSRTQWYNHEIRNGIEVNFTRDPPLDSDLPFRLTRSSCKKELEELVAEINRKAENLRDQANSIADVDRSFHESVQSFRNEIDEQVHEEVFDIAVPAPVRLATVDYSDDPNGHISAWTDLIEDFAESTGRLIIQKGAKLAGLADVIVDLGLINAKGLTVLKETGQINNELSDMRTRRNESLHSWANSMAAYQKLSELCLGELPKEQQPKPTSSIISSAETEGLDRASTEAQKMHASIGKEIEAAETETASAAIAIEKLAMFLEPYRNADRNKTLKQLMGDAGIATLKTLMIEMGKSWMTVLRSIHIIDQNLKKVQALPAPAVG